MACVPPLRRGPRIARTSCTAIRLPCWGTLSDSRRISAIFQGGFYTGSWLSPKDWMRWERMAAARRLLLQDRPVETISRILGFADLNSFRREFREVHQVTLTSFRRSRGFGVV
jgi:AraC-like DNA-binding protein